MNFRQTLLAATFALTPAAAMAAPVTIFEAEGDVFVDNTDPDAILADFLDLDGNDIDISVAGDFTFGVANAALLVSSPLDDELVRSDDVVSFDLDRQPGAPDTLSVIFGNLAGTAAGQFGDTLTALFSFSEEDAVNGFFTPVRVQLQADRPSPVPLPATLPLLALGLGAFGLARRRDG